jgi:hypothetical protein
MRQGQQHRRGRGRNNNNRKSQNPLARSFESNGPDVKVRGTPAHIAEKYLSLARDAQSSGDPVLAENYLQHAEHYNRIIMAYREQQMQHSGEMNGAGPRMRPDGMDGDESSEDDGDDFGQSEQPPVHGFGYEQPRFQGSPRGDDNRPHRNHEHGRFRDRHDRGERHERQFDRQPHDARQGRDHRPESQPPPPPAEGAPPVQGRGDQQPHRRRERFGPGNEQPEFLRRPVRRPRRDDANGEGEDTANGSSHDDGDQDKSTV